MKPLTTLTQTLTVCIAKPSLLDRIWISIEVKSIVRLGSVRGRLRLGSGRLQHRCNSIFSTYSQK